MEGGRVVEEKTERKEDEKRRVGKRKGFRHDW